MIWATPYQSATACTGTARPGARALLAWALEVYRPRGAYSLGIYNCRTVVGGSTTSTHGEGRAVDLGLPVGPDGKGTPLGRSIVAQIGAHGARLGVQAIVYDREVWSAKSPDGRYYGGAHPHYDHLHIELTRQAADRLTLATFRAVLGGAGVREEDIMRQGDSGNRVAAWQSRLPWVGVETTVDGDFGPKTVEATKKAQAILGLEQDGEVHATEWALLVAVHSGNQLTEHGRDEGLHGGAPDLSGYAQAEHKHTGRVTVQ